MPEARPAPFWHAIRVYYEDTDASGVVYHANYFRYCERARTEWLRACGLGNRALAEQFGVAFTLVDTQMRFRAPARLDDVVQVSAEVIERKRARLVFAQDISCAGRPLIKAKFTIACVTMRDFKPCRLPVELIKELE